MQTTPFQNWILTEADHIATLRLNRAAAMNTLTPAALRELRQIARYLGKQDTVWAIILESEGAHFSAGVDVSVIGSMIGQDPLAFATELRDLQDCLDEFESLAKPIIAKIRGYCIGGGLIMALCCDFRVADESAIFYLPEVKLGIAVIMGTQRITRLVGETKAKELILLAERFNAVQAQQYGLLTRLVKAEELDNTVNEFAAKFRQLPPRTIGIAKRIIEDGARLTLRASQELEIELQSTLLNHPDFSEGVQAFFEKRPPHFQG